MWWKNTCTTGKVLLTIMAIIAIIGLVVCFSGYSAMKSESPFKYVKSGNIECTVAANYRYLHIVNTGKESVRILNVWMWIIGALNPW